MEERRPRERELVLAPNEYAWVLDTTKGHINCYVGPNKTSLAQTDQLVMFHEQLKRFVPAEMQQAVQLFATAPENWYLILKNPAVDGHHPRAGVSSTLTELQVGKKVVIPGPVSFALWPGQMARVVEAHRLQSNEYVVARVYDAAEAQKHVADVLARDVTDDDEAITFEVGQRIVIPGTRCAFYMPPNGVEVEPDEQGQLVRRAVSLQRLEYCVLIRENGARRTVRGEAVVFPQPDERFLERQGRRQFRAVELSETTGLHIKVTAPYVDDDGVQHAEGEELFITGATRRLYFPRDEHVTIRSSGGGELHHAVAIPAGEGRYVLNRHTGEVGLVAGPRMFLADPRHEVITRRVLSDRECVLYYPQNTEALAFNRQARGVGPVATQAIVGVPARGPRAMPNDVADVADAVDVADAARSGQTTRETAIQRGFEKPSSLYLDTKYDGAVTVEVWSGYAVCVKDRRGGRRVITGPQSVMLAFDETLEALTLSTGTPKSTARLLPTVYLRVAGNQVSDVIEVTSSDLVTAHVRLTWRVGFEGDAARWFVVDNYVKLLTEHAASIVKARLRKVPIRTLRADVAELVRDAVLGARGDNGRAGLIFEENGMRVFDVEVHSVDVADAEVRALLDEAQHDVVRSAIEVDTGESVLRDRQRLEAMNRQRAAEEHTTRLAAQQLQRELEERTQELERLRLEHRVLLMQEKQRADLLAARADVELRQTRLAARKEEADADLIERERAQALDVALLEAQTSARVAQATAVSPELTASLTRLGDSQLLSHLAQNFGELAAVEGRGLLETARKFLDFVPGGQLPMLRPTVTTTAAREGDAE